MSTLGIKINVTSQPDAYKIGTMLIQGIQKQLSGPRHGRWYPAPGNKLFDKYNPNKPKNYYLKFTGTQNRNEIQGAAYRASMAGEAPASYTGRLRQSFLMTIKQLNSKVWQLEVRTKVIYADDLEFGTHKIAARPYIRPVIQEITPEIVKMNIRAALQIIR